MADRRGKTYALLGMREIEAFAESQASLFNARLHALPSGGARRFVRGIFGQGAQGRPQHRSLAAGVKMRDVFGQTDELSTRKQRGLHA